RTASTRVLLTDPLGQLGTCGHETGAVEFGMPTNFAVVSLEVAGNLRDATAHIAGALPSPSRSAMIFCGALSSWYMPGPCPRTVSVPGRTEISVIGPSSRRESL